MTGSAAPQRYWFVGPESSIYHTRKNCPLLNNVYRYWPLENEPFPPEGRRLCKGCAKWEASLVVPGVPQ
jgi:hypothetical protein